ncbi:MAG: transcription-repair coupling factor [Bacillales bacterium]
MIRDIKNELLSLTNNIDNNYISCDPLNGAVYLTLSLLKNNDKNIVLLCKNNNDVINIYRLLNQFINENKILKFTDNDLFRLDFINETKEILGENIYNLDQLLSSTNKVILLPLSIIYRYFPDKDLFKDSILFLEKNKNYNFENIKEKLFNLGYERKDRVSHSLQYSVRGDIIDVFSINYDYPIRLEFFDNLLENIKFFDVSTQLSFENKNDIKILPATYLLFNKEDKQNSYSKIDKVISEIKSSNKIQNKEPLIEDINLLKDDIDSNNITEKNYKFYKYFVSKTCTIFDYIKNYITIFVSYNDFINAKNNLLFDCENFLKELPLFNFKSDLINIFQDYNLQQNSNKFYYIDNYFENKNSYMLDITNNNLQNIFLKNFSQSLKLYLDDGYNIVFFAENINELNLVKSKLDNINTKYIINNDFILDTNYPVNIVLSGYDSSFEISSKKIVFISSKDIFKFKRHNSTFKSHFREGVVLNNYEELTPGDYVVHEKYGIGKFIEFKTVKILDKLGDYITIEYQNNNKLLVPLYHFDIIRKYAGKEGKVPKLDNLYTKSWDKTKNRIKERINVLAERLLTLFNNRNKSKGYKFISDKQIEKEFGDKFEHELTADQEKSIQEIFSDMEKNEPMERLLCGDVGFGKTEIAFRAAFKSIINNKLVVLICPTVLLAKQHFNTALERFKDYDINIKLFTRELTIKDENNLLSDISSKKIDFLIGTHKLFSKNIDYSNLGLLIIDEEQRFGVEQKEIIKERFKDIDVLSLSATPIPRTLQSTLVGMKQVSIIDTPPKDRISVQTYLIPFKKESIKLLINKELSRNGQIFYIHNNVESIYSRAKMVQDLVSNAKIGIVHGKMKKELADQVMEDFYNGDIDILIATSIIENGIDVENANLILIENADRFGLSQLYQIKGRVGRSYRMAYCYLMIDESKDISNNAKKRLKAIQDFSKLGSGYKIAQRDLLIRGAGDILGPEQAGFIDSIGIDMYIKLLNETINEKKGIFIDKTTKIKTKLSLESYIPSYYIKDEEKVDVYHNIISCKDEYELDKLLDNIQDIYGKAPKNIHLLFLQSKIDLYFNNECFDDLKEYTDNIVIILSQKFSDIEGIASNLFLSLMNYKNIIRMMYVSKKIHVKIVKDDNWAQVLFNVIKIIYQLYERSIKHEN